MPGARWKLSSFAFVIHVQIRRTSNGIDENNPIARKAAMKVAAAPLSSKNRVERVKRCSDDEVKDSTVYP